MERVIMQNTNRYNDREARRVDPDYKADLTCTKQSVLADPAVFSGLTYWSYWLSFCEGLHCSIRVAKVSTVEMYAGREDPFM